MVPGVAIEPFGDLALQHQHEPLEEARASISRSRIWLPTLYGRLPTATARRADPRAALQ